MSRNSRSASCEAADPEVGDAERLADRRLLRLPPLRLLERHRRLRVPAVRHVLAALLEEVVGLAHRLLQRYGKFCRTTSSGLVRSRVGPSSSASDPRPRSSASRKACASSNGGPGRSSSARAEPAAEEPERRPSAVGAAAFRRRGDEPVRDPTGVCPGSASACRTPSPAGAPGGEPALGRAREVAAAGRRCRPP